MTVFPGGGVDGADDTDLRWVGPGADWWAEKYATSPVAARMLVVAAVRETFEECGYCSRLRPTADPARELVADDRAALVGNSRSALSCIGEVLRYVRIGLRRWHIGLLRRSPSDATAPTSFLAALPGTVRRPTAPPSEASTSARARPADALDARSRGVHSLLPPHVGTTAGTEPVPHGRRCPRHRPRHRGGGRGRGR